MQAPANAGESAYIGIRKLGLRIPSLWYLVTRTGIKDLSYALGQYNRDIHVLCAPVFAAIIEGAMTGFVVLVDADGNSFPPAQSTAELDDYSANNVYPRATSLLLEQTELPDDPMSNFSIAIMARLRSLTIDSDSNSGHHLLSLVDFVIACSVQLSGPYSALYIPHGSKAMRRSLTPNFLLKEKQAFRTRREITERGQSVISQLQLGLKSFLSDYQQAVETVQEPYLSIVILMMELLQPEMVLTLVGMSVTAENTQAIRECIQQCYLSGISYTAWAMQNDLGMILSLWRSPSFSFDSSTFNSNIPKNKKR